MEKTVILIEELFDCYACDRPAKRTLTYQGFTIINDDFSEILSEI